MTQGNVEFVAKTDHFLGFEGNSVICNDLLRTAKSGQNVGFKELDNGGVIGLPTWDGFNPLGEIVVGC